MGECFLRRRRGCLCNAIGHNFDYDTLEYDDAVHFYECIRCDARTDEEEHVMGEWAEDGNYWHRRHCTYCAYDALEAHDTNGDMTVETEPTCTEEGEGYYTCSVCGHIHSADGLKPIPALGHDWNTLWDAYEGGAVGSVCARCDYMQITPYEAQCPDNGEHFFGILEDYDNYDHTIGCSCGLTVFTSHVYTNGVCRVCGHLEN